MCAVSIEQLIERRIDKWRALELPHPGTRPLAPRRPVVTISREFGAGGRQVAEALASRMGLILFDRELIDCVAEQAGISARIVSSLDETSRSDMETWVEGILKARIFDRTEYVHCLLKVMKSLAMRGGCIILGRGANFILQNEPAAYHFRLVAPLDVRVARIAARDGLSHDEALKLVNRVGRERRKFLKDTFPRHNVDDLLSYHMVFNSGRVGIEAIVEIICRFVENAERSRLAT
ncbi:MAG: cytidylate kinase-like family protein [Candidatus Sumerlaeia bacterium]